MNEMLECPCCLEQYTRHQRPPLVLICGHTLCKECSSTLEAQGALVCPLDKKRDERKVSQISHSYHILDLIEQVTSMMQTIKYMKLSPDERIEAAQVQTKEQIELLNEHLSEVQEKIGCLKQQEEELKHSVRQDFNIIRDQLNAREAEILDEVSHLAKQNLTQFNQVEQQLKEQLAELNQVHERVLTADTFDESFLQVKPNLPDLPLPQLKVHVALDVDSSARYVRGLGTVVEGNEVKRIDCDYFNNVTYWMLPPCCYKRYCCNKCHDSKESHSWVYANRMICMLCGGEQDYKKLPNRCAHCDAQHDGVVSK